MFVILLAHTSLSVTPVFTANVIRYRGTVYVKKSLQWPHFVDQDCYHQNVCLHDIM